LIHLENIKTIFFDYDGTLHNGMKIYAPAFRAAYSYLVDQRYAAPKKWSEEEISYWLGFSPPEMWQAFMPNVDEEERIKCSKIISQSMKSSTISGAAELYEGSLEVLSHLKNKGYHLIFISNCKIYYKEAHNKIFKLDRYFEKLIASEEYNYMSKAEIIDIVKQEYPEEMVIIGDRLQDIDAGRKNHFYTIGCSYGYGQLGEFDNADLIIDNIMELKALFK